MKRRLLTIFTHILIWIALLFLFSHSARHDHHPVDLIKPDSKPFDYLDYFNFLYVVFYYFNYYKLIPTFFLTKKYSLYVLFVIISYILIISISYFFSCLLSDQIMPLQFIVGFVVKRSLFVFSLALLISLGFRINNEFRRAEEEKEIIEKKRIDAELAFLKAQINPHFLFNSLNSIYGLAIIHSDQTSEAVLKLSNIMRHVIAEANTAFVPLTRELVYIESYIDLQKLRLAENNNVDFSIKGNPSDLEISPLLLIPFIENAFKYGISTRDETNIRISVEIIGDELFLMTTNAKTVAKQNLGQSMGVGIENTKRRLQMIYRKKHLLTITEDENNYHVNLSIKLK